MSLTIELTEEQVRALKAQAESQGLTVERLAQRLVEQAVPPQSVISLQLADPTEWERQFREWAMNHDHTTPLLSDYALSRNSIYED